MRNPVIPVGIRYSGGPGRPLRPRAASRFLGIVALLLALVPSGSGRADAPPGAGVPENLVADGIPAIPASVVEEVRKYTEYRSAGLADWNPLRREMLIATRFGNTVQIHQVAGPGMDRTQLTFFGEPVGGASYEPKNGKYFLFTRDTGGNEFGQIYRYDFASAKVTLLTDGGRSQNGGIEWANAGGRIAYGSTRRNGADRDIYLMDPMDPKSDRRLLEVQGGGWSVDDWSPDDRQLLVLEELSINQSFPWLVDASNGAKTALTPRETPEPVAYQSLRFSQDGKGVYLLTDLDSEFTRLAYLDLATRKVTPLTADLALNVEAFEISPDGRTVAFVASDHGDTRLRFLDTRTRKHREAKGVPPGLIGGLVWHRKDGILGITVSTVASAGDAYALDPAAGTATRWTFSETGGIDTSALPEPELIRWKSFDGLEISGFYYRPPARFTGRRPVVITIHGGPEGQARPGFQGRANYHLLELGLALVYPNVRGSTGYGKTFTKLDNGMKRLDSVKDIGALLDWIGTRPELDAGRVMITGGSYGGYMTLASATMYNDRIRCSLDVVGISNFITFLENTESYRRDLRRVEYGDERDPEMRAFFEKIAPVKQVDRITKPLFVVQGANDPRVPRIESEQMVKTLKERGTPVWYLLGKDEGHGFRKKANADFQFYATVAFVREFLLADRGAAGGR